MADLGSGNLTNYLLVSIVLIVAIFCRYLLFAGIFYYFFSLKNNFSHKRINVKAATKAQIKKEISYSFISSVIFGIMGTFLVWLWQAGKTEIRLEWRWSDLYSIPLGLILILSIHESYYYWMHRIMHHPSVYKWVHKAHHQSLITTSWSSFSFHPFESFLQALPLFLLMIWLPVHLLCWIFMFLIMAITSVINHLNAEMYPHTMSTHWIGKWIIGATHHHLHHSQFLYNFGLYFTFWDHWMKTESPDYIALFKKITGK